MFWPASCPSRRDAGHPGLEPSGHVPDGDENARQTKGKTRVENLSVRIKVSDHLRTGSPVEVTVLVTNSGNTPVLVNRRLLVNHEVSEGELFFRIESSTNKNFTFQALVTPRDLDDNDFQVLKSGESISKTVDLSNRYAVKEPGQYKITAIYRNTYHRSKAGLDAWIGSVASTPIIITLEKS
jgi:hypothetical protein